MSTTTTTSLFGGLPPAHWRVINALSYAGAGGINAHTLTTSQDIGWEQTCEMDEAQLIAGTLGSMPVDLADLVGPTNSLKATAVRVRLTLHGRQWCVGNRANQVICTLGGQPNQRARVRDCRAEGMADDDLLRRMESCHLINVTVDGVPMPLAAFKRIPPQLLVHLSAKGRHYFPNGTGR